MDKKIKILQYKKINEIIGRKDLSLDDKIIICASPNMASALNCEYQKGIVVISIGDILKYLSDGWDSEEVKLRQRLNLNNIISEMIRNENIKDEYKQLLESIKGNKSDFISSLRLLVECGVYPENFEGEKLSDEEKLFLLIWKELELREESILKFRNKFDIKLKNKEKLIHEYEKAIIEVYKKQFKDYKIENKELQGLFNNNINKKIIEKPILFQGFYFITPMQERLINLMKDVLNLNITFLNHNDNNNFFNIWKKTFSKDFGYSSYEDDIKVEKNEGTIWSDVFSNISNLNLIEYDNVLSFYDRFHNETNKYYSLDFKNLNNIILEYEPTDDSGIKRILDSPIGEFIMILNKLWIEKNSQEDMSFESIRKCFATGWLEDKDSNGKNYINAKDYIKQLEYIEDFLNKIEELEENKESLITLLTNPRCKKLIIDYEILKNIPYYAVNKCDINQIHNFIKKIDGYLDILSKGNNKKDVIFHNVGNHFKKIIEILEKLKQTAPQYQQKNKDIESLQTLLKVSLLDDIECLPEDMIDALDTILGKKKEVDKENIIEEIVNKESSTQKVMNLRDIEVAMLESKDIHILQVTDKNMPGKQGQYTWPLSNEFIEKCRINNKESRTLLNRLKLIINEKESINKYLFYTLLQCSNKINVVLIKNIEQEEFNWSVYIDLLGKDISQGDKYTSNYEGKNEKIKKIDINLENIYEKFINIIESCPKRYFMYDINDKEQTYSSLFQQQFVFSRILQLYKDKYIYDYNQGKDINQRIVFKGNEQNLYYGWAFSEIGKYFPVWNDNEKKYILNNASKQQNYIRDNRNFKYSNDEFNETNRKIYTPPLLIPGPEKLGCKIEYYKNAKTKTKEAIKVETINGIVKGNPANEKNCMYCSYNYCCNEAIYPIDFEND